ncbi:MarR family transcriptional regulator [Acidaminobacter sp. JC074]|uniref:MarR family winged helix-turn-helix transcriptional regulator n=1 Tax=Acidaminobacter sp. JC074 TaxID=2530199 RepID=UPI001F10031D|nr:MarR family transcriptional regulator [Acidaminobacter sp. JC074]MCH4888663.1 MarR family transcriptional regulator [Acidaminobacter sp. JC074]
MYDLFVLLQEVMRHNHKLLHKNLEPYGLYKGQPKILGLLSHHEALSKKDIAERFKLAMPTVTKTIERLEKNGFVSTFQDASDKRRTLVKLTDKGREVHNDLISFKKSYAEIIFDGISQEELLQMKSVLEKVKLNVLEYDHEKND